MKKRNVIAAGLSQGQFQPRSEPLFKGKGSSYNRRAFKRELDYDD
jgi:stalled ribosome alternative rescue factor ArfA